jgi:putative drug exporter of the RND superfamily
VLVAGAAAPYVDLQHSLGSHLPLALAIVAALTIVILFVMTGSLILPLKAARGSHSLPRGSRAASRSCCPS